MQTFLPYPDFKDSARVLDNKRLGKQRVETLQILNALTGKSRGWVNHPATKMWRGHEEALVLYGLDVCVEWVSRGFNDTCYQKLIALHAQIGNGRKAVNVGLRSYAVMPPWLGDPDFHASHRSNLIRKLPAHYGTIWPTESDDLPYIWPVQ